ncbi:MAG: L,D-transpeptidase [Propionibacteriaceae bacterium]|jgi:hypothetical protein|nr:L,D-transpeptidase [Propionibacteriaceae bacterium]
MSDTNPPASPRRFWIPADENVSEADTGEGGAPGFIESVIDTEPETLADAPVSVAAGTSDDTPPSKLRRRKTIIALLVVLGLLLAVGGAVGGVWLTHRGKAAPGATIGGHPVGGMTRAEVVSYLDGLSKQLEFEISVAGVTQRVYGETLGVDIDAEGSAETAFTSWDAEPLLRRLNPWQELPAAIIGSYDVVKLQTYLDGAFKGTPALLPTVTFDEVTATWTANSGQPGFGVSAATLLPALRAAVETGGLRKFSANPTTVEPAVSITAATASADLLNEIIHNLPTIQYQDEPRYAITAADVAAWAVLTPNGFEPRYDLTFNTEAIIAAVEGPLAPLLLIKGSDEFRLDTPDGRDLQLMPGVDGLQVADPTKLAASIATALLAHDGSSLTPEWRTAPHAIKHITAGPYHEGRWVDINLTAQTLIMFVGDDPVVCYRISSGKEKTPTTPGSYQVTDKSESATISGPTWHYTGVVWVAWNRLYGIVGASWRNEFGFPLSGGLIELSPADALQLYTWVSVGDPLEIHG